MDEPFSALDALTRGALQQEVRRIFRETRQTVSMITHDVDEACYPGDRIAIMTAGPGARIAGVLQNLKPDDRDRTAMLATKAYRTTRSSFW